MVRCHSQVWSPTREQASCASRRSHTALKTDVEARDRCLHTLQTKAWLCRKCQCSEKVREDRLWWWWGTLNMREQRGRLFVCTRKQELPIYYRVAAGGLSGLPLSLSHTHVHISVLSLSFFLSHFLSNIVDYSTAVPHNALSLLTVAGGWGEWTPTVANDQKEAP